MNPRVISFRHAPARAVAAAAVAVVLGVSGVLSAQDSLPEVGEQVAVLEDVRIKESSGLAAGVRDPSIFWVINDSGGEPCVFAIDQKGRTRAKVRIRDAANFDWEALGSYRDAEGKGWLFIGDVGDNLHVRPTVQIYQVAEPELPPLEDAHKEIESAKPRIWHVIYPDGRLNAESLLVHPKTGRLYIINKTDTGNCALYAVPEKVPEGKAVVMEKVTDLSFPPTVRLGKRPMDASQISAAAFARDGSRMLAVSYSYLYEWVLREDEPLAEALKRPPQILKPPLLHQLEGACYDVDSRSIWLISERLPTPLVKIERRE